MPLRAECGARASLVCRGVRRIDLVGLHDHILHTSKPGRGRGGVRLVGWSGG